MKTICIVDDTESVRITVSALLESTYKVVEAGSGNELYALLENVTPDLILLDIMMPDSNGVAIKTKLKGDPKFKDIPIVFLTAVEDEQVKKVAQIQSGDYINKPFTKKELLAAVAKFID